MKNETLRGAITGAIASSAALSAWCATTFGKQVTVFSGVDRMQLPQPEDQAASESGDYPFVAIDITEKTQGVLDEGETIVVSAFCALLDGGSYVVSGGVRNLPGIEKRDKFRALVLQAIVSADIAGVVQRVETADLPVEYFPEFATDMSIEIYHQYTFRENRFE